MEIPRLRWLKDVENDLRVHKANEWSQKPSKGEEWAAVKEAKVLTALQSQGVSK
jgi:hypothetical protein